MENYYALDNENHHNIDFTVTDGVFSTLLIDLGFGLTTMWVTSEATIKVIAQLYSPGIDAFRTGTFNFTSLPGGQVEDDRLVGEFFFNETYVVIDTNGDKEVDDEDELEVTGGTIQVSGTYPEYTLVYDLVVENGVTLRGSFAFSDDNTTIDD